MSNSKKFIDPIAEARKDKRFSLYSSSARIAIRLGVEVYEKRTRMGLSQMDLAKKIGSTQRVISNIENGEINIGLDLLKRLSDGLGFSQDDLGSIFESTRVFSFQNSSANITANSELPKTNLLIYETNQYQY